MRGLLERGIAGLDRIGHGQAVAGRVLRVAVEELPGELSRLLAVLEEFDVTADNVVPSPFGNVLSVEFTVATPRAQPLVRRLAAEGWSAEREDPQVGARLGALT